MPLLDVVNLAVPGVPARVLSFRLNRGEIVALLVAVDVDRPTLMRMLSSLPRTSAPTDVGPAGRDLQVLDDTADILRSGHETSGWAKLAAERASGTGVVLATRRVDRAYRADRVILAGWSLDALLAELEEVFGQMRPLLAALLDPRSPGRSSRRAVVSELRRFTHASSDLLREAHRLAPGPPAHLQVARMAAERAGLALGDGVLDALANEDADE